MRSLLAFLSLLERMIWAVEMWYVHYGRIMDGERTIDDVLATVFRAPHSYTGEDSVEISCHGSAYIVSEILRCGWCCPSPRASCRCWPG